jgi:hypothetical protein
LRFLIVDDDADYRQLLRYHLEVEWPDAVIAEYQPSSAGPLPTSLPLAGVDLVLLGHPTVADDGLGSSNASASARTVRQCCCSRPRATNSWSWTR